MRGRTNLVTLPLPYALGGNVNTADDVLLGVMNS